MLSLIHNLRFDRNKKDYDHSFKKKLNNYNTSELVMGDSSVTLENKLLSSDWISIYRKQ
ncbi:MAG: hypothetical protein VX976_02810 [Pseudomonadota bacterium]|nr:hypothetical protein [Pseudomonadota bacterium]